MKKGYFTKCSYEDKFDRKYACWTHNHNKAWSEYKTANRRTARRKIKAETQAEIQEYYLYNIKKCS